MDHSPVEEQADPTGRDAHESGAKLDLHKPEPELIQRGFSRALQAVELVGSYGAFKYTRDGWEEVPRGIPRYTNAMFRHLRAEFRGEAFDTEPLQFGYPYELLHAAQVAWNALARCEKICRALEADGYDSLGEDCAPPGVRYRSLLRGEGDE